MQHGLHDIYCSAQHDQCSLIIRTFWLHGVVGADLRPDNYPQGQPLTLTSYTRCHVCSRAQLCICQQRQIVPGRLYQIMLLSRLSIYD
jgi:hypothetical protein